jgi:xylulokinase
MLCGLADGLDALTAQGVRPRRMLLIGGAAQSRAVQTIAPEIFGLPVTLPNPAEYVALGAAKQAAWSLATQANEGPQPIWANSEPLLLNPSSRRGHESVRAAYKSLLDTVHGEAKPAL